MGTFNSPVKSGLRQSTFLGNWKLRGVRVCMIREEGVQHPVTTGGGDPGSKQGVARRILL